MGVGYAYLPDPYRKKAKREDDMITQRCRREQQSDYSYMDAYMKHRKGAHR